MQTLVTLALLVGTLLSMGCATKKFVREELGKSDANFDERVGRLDADLGQERTRLNSVSEEVRLARTVADDATRRADQAGGAAERAAGAASQALTKADDTDSRLSRLWANRNKRNLVETVIVTFAFDKWELSDGAQTKLLDVVRDLKENPNLIVDLEGFTDSMGPAPYNLQLSQRRAEAVRRFLVQNGVDLHRIQSIGLGVARPAPEAKTTPAQNRRVAVKLSLPTD